MEIILELILESNSLGLLPRREGWETLITIACTCKRLHHYFSQRYAKLKKQIMGVYWSIVVSDTHTKAGYIKNNKFEGKWLFYYNGQPLPDVYFFGNGLSNGKRIVYHFRGGAPQIHFIKYFKNGRSDGPYKSFYQTGNVYEMCWFEDGVEHGEYRTYTDRGTIRHRKLYSKGEMIRELPLDCSEGRELPSKRRKLNH